MLVSIKGISSIYPLNSFVCGAVIIFVIFLAVLFAHFILHRTAAPIFTTWPNVFIYLKRTSTPFFVVTQFASR